jgi:hypothetical protein
LRSGVVIEEHSLIPVSSYCDGSQPWKWLAKNKMNTMFLERRRLGVTMRLNSTAARREMSD